jgi:hypothetical protein
VHAEAGHAAVGEDVEAQVGEALVDVDGEEVLRVALQGRLGEQLGPHRLGSEQLLGRGVGAGDGALDRAVIRVVSAEEGGVHHHPADDAGEAEADEAEVVAGGAAAARLPAVHPFAAVGVLVLEEDRGLRLEQVLLLGEEVVVGPDHGASEALGGEIDELGEGSRRSGRSGHHASRLRMRPSGEP